MLGNDFFKFCFILTIFIMVFIFSSNIERLPKQKQTKERIVYKSSCVDKIKKLIDDGVLSNKEALFYKVIEP